MMLTFVAFALAAAPAPAAPLAPSPQDKTFTLHVPDEISPAMDTYVRCRLESAGETMTDSAGTPEKPLVEKGGDCTAIRIKAVADADALLAQRGKNEAARAKLIAKTVKNIDDFADQMGRMMAAAGDKAK